MERTVRYSKKREAILAVIRGTGCHPSAEWVYRQLKPCHPDLSLGTVYRNLAFFRETGQLHSVGVVQGQERFDANIAPHSHFICNCCGTVLDLSGLRPDAGLDEAVSRQYGLAVDRCELTFYGLCPSCTSQQPINKEEPLS
ncbi:MAG: transcriptional repressor [Lawsonibacter sp.]|nr:transcriptional repressor [Lawsonibacter sp.]